MEIREFSRSGMLNVKHLSLTPAWWADSHYNKFYVSLYSPVIVCGCIVYHICRFNTLRSRFTHAMFPKDAKSMTTANKKCGALSTFMSSLQ